MLFQQIIIIQIQITQNIKFQLQYFRFYFVKNINQILVFLLAQQEKVQGQFLCETCVKLIDEVEDFGIEAIDQLFELICDLFTDPTQQQECKTFIDDQFELIYEWIQQDYPGDYLCTLLQLCDYPIPDVNDECDGCQIGFQILEDIWSYGPTLDLFEQVINFICYMFPEDSQLRSDCEIYMDYEFEDIISWIDSTFPPSYICTIVGACDFPIQPVEDGLCLFCKESLNLLYDAFDFGTINSEEYVKQVLDYLCYIFPDGSENRQQCDQFINQEYDELVNYIINEFPPESCCILMGACESDIQPEYTTECEFCHIIYQFFLDLISFDATEEDIEMILDVVCNIVPQTIRDECVKFINEEYEQIINDLINGHPTEQACINVGYCQE